MIKAVGAAVLPAIEISLKFQREFPKGFEVKTETFTVAVQDEIISTEEEHLGRQTRLNSGIQITISKNKLIRN